MKKIPIQTTNQPESIIISQTGRHKKVANLADGKVKTLFQSIPTLQLAFKEGHKCCPTMHPSGAKLHIDQSFLWYRKGKAFCSLNQKCCIFPSLFFFVQMLSLKQKLFCNHMKQKKTWQQVLIHLNFSSFIHFAYVKGECWLKMYLQLICSWNERHNSELQVNVRKLENVGKLTKCRVWANVEKCNILGNVDAT